MADPRRVAGETVHVGEQHVDEFGIHLALRNCGLCQSTLAVMLPGHVVEEPTQPLFRPLPEHGDPIWSLGHETARLVVDFVLDELPGEVAR